jgi:hypothetical protein
MKSLASRSRDGNFGGVAVVRYAPIGALNLRSAFRALRVRLALDATGCDLTVERSLIKLE